MNRSALRPSRQFPSVQAAILAIAVLGTFATALWGDFVWIDRAEILDAGYRIADKGDFQKLWTLTLDQYLDREQGPIESRGGYWRPVYALSLSLDWLLWNDNAWCYHLENVAWHLTVVIGLLLLGRRLLQQYPNGAAISFWATLLFAVHPLGVHSVTWISGRKDAMCAAFAVWSLLCFCRLLDDVSETRRRPVLHALLATILLLLALGTKELAAVVPLIASGLLLFSARRQRRERNATTAPKRAALITLGLLWGCVFLVAAYRSTQLGGFGLNASYPADSLMQNVATSATLFWHYVGRVFAAVHPAISDAWPISQEVTVLQILAIASLVLLLIGVAIGLYRRWAIALALAWFFIWLLPASGIVPLRHLKAERYLYPASWGLLLAFTVALFAVSARWPRVSAKYLQTGLALLAVAGAVTTSFANLAWKNEATLFAISLELDPKHVEARLGLAHLALQDERFEDCVTLSEQAIVDGSNDGYATFWSEAIAHNNLGLALLQLDRAEDAYVSFQRVAQLQPQRAAAHYHLGRAAFDAGRLPTAEKHYRRAIELAPTDYESRSNLALTLLHRKQLVAAIELFTTLLKERPEDTINLGNLGAALLAMGNFRAAAGPLKKLLSIDPTQSLQRAKLAWCQSRLGKTELARENIERAIRESPRDPAIRDIQKLVQLPGDQ